MLATVTSDTSTEAARKMLDLVAKTRKHLVHSRQADRTKAWIERVTKNWRKNSAKA